MTPTEFRAIIARFGLSQVEAGKLLGYSGRNGQRWATGESKIPPSVALIFMALDLEIISIAEIEQVKSAPPMLQ